MVQTNKFKPYYHPTLFKEIHSDKLEPKIMSLVDSLASSIATMEGWFSPTINRSQLNNNPGNLRAGAGMVGTDNHGLAIFPDAETGWNALYRQISLDAGRGATLGSFIGKYAPPNENDTSNYLNVISGKTGIPTDTKLSDLYAGINGKVAEVTTIAQTTNNQAFNGGGDELVNSSGDSLFAVGGGNGIITGGEVVVGLVILTGVAMLSRLV